MIDEKIRELGLKTRRIRSALKGIEKIKMTLGEKAYVVYDETAISVRPQRIRSRSRYYSKNHKFSIMIAYDLNGEYGYYRIVLRPTNRLNSTQIQEFWLDVANHDPRFKCRWIADLRFKHKKSLELILKFRRSDKWEREHILGFKKGVYREWSRLDKNQKSFKTLVNLYKAYLNWLGLRPI